MGDDQALIDDEVVESIPLDADEDSLLEDGPQERPAIDLSRVKRWFDPTCASRRCRTVSTRVVLRLDHAKAADLDSCRIAASSLVVPAVGAVPADLLDSEDMYRGARIVGESWPQLRGVLDERPSLDVGPGSEADGSPVTQRRVADRPGNVRDTGPGEHVGPRGAVRKAAADQAKGLHKRPIAEQLIHDVERFAEDGVKPAWFAYLGIILDCDAHVAAIADGLGIHQDDALNLVEAIARAYRSTPDVAAIRDVLRATAT